MGKKICCLCHKTRIADRWSQTVVMNRDEIVHGLCPTCFAETREKVRQIYAPVPAEQEMLNATQQL